MKPQLDRDAIGAAIGFGGAAICLLLALIAHALGILT
jgi:hypothetical protein